ncbi:uncharacterized protein LOC111385747 [Olea europaea var. sylvestris]|uniref:uncharacterized protein LOC111385747 n=1 Tax=Olea europaea var. sylvestris TaxID=158386 RepID=UPI000C1D03CF|nr:uncharacterized protein LOC111385747 [Olea europaea var. sylvestris]
MSTSVNLGHDPTGKSVDKTLYRSMIGSLLYITSSRPDIAFRVGVCVRLQVDPKENHLSAMRHIIRYVDRTVDHGILYPRDSNHDLAIYSDVHWAENVNDRKSASGDCFYVGSNLVPWMNKKQNLDSLSMIEAEYIVADSCCTQLLWIKQMLNDYEIN